MQENFGAKQHKVSHFIFASATMIGCNGPIYAANRPSCEIIARQILDVAPQSSPELQIVVTHVAPTLGREASVTIASLDQLSTSVNLSAP